jgi:hypothetical protein
MKRLVVLFTLLTSTLMQAQTITFAEATRNADELVARNILNKKGKTTLLKEIQTKAIETEHPSTVNPTSYTEDALSKVTIMQFCAQAFFREQVQRLLIKPSHIEEKIKQEDSIIERNRAFHSFNHSSKYAGCISSLRSTIGFTRMRTMARPKVHGTAQKGTEGEWC